MKQKKSLGTIMKREWPLHVMLLPAIILLLIFAYLPMAVSYTHLTLPTIYSV